MLRRHTKHGAHATAASTLRALGQTTKRGDGPLSGDELLRLAKQFVGVRTQLRAVFDALPEADRDAGMEITERLRQADEEAKNPYYSDSGRFARGRAGLDAGSMVETEAEKAAREQELSRIIAASEDARRRLGQRTSASELGKAGLLDALYGGRRR